jgi:hypothetical protein
VEVGSVEIWKEVGRRYEGEGDLKLKIEKRKKVYT